MALKASNELLDNLALHMIEDWDAAVGSPRHNSYTEEGWAALMALAKLHESVLLQVEEVMGVWLFYVDSDDPDLAFAF